MKSPKQLAEEITIAFDAALPEHFSWSMAVICAKTFIKLKTEGVGEGLDLNIEDEKEYWKSVKQEIEKL